MGQQGAGLEGAALYQAIWQGPPDREKKLCPGGRGCVVGDMWRKCCQEARLVKVAQMIGDEDEGGLQGFQIIQTLDPQGHHGPEQGSLNEEPPKAPQR
jgi:hypothetical protein